MADPMQELSDWLDANWDPSLTVGEWWQILADAGYAKPSLPEHAHGKGWSQAQETAAMRLMASKDVLGPPPGLGFMLAAPTIAAHGSQEQIDRYIPPIPTDKKLGASCSASPPPAQTSLASRPRPNATVTSGESKAKRSGPRRATQLISACSSPAPTLRSPSTAA